MKQVTEELVGKIFGRLTVVAYVGHRKTPGDSRRPYYKCRCICGSVGDYNGHNLTTGHIKSCGCMLTEKLILRNSTHRASYTPEYSCFYHAKERCNNPSIKHWEDYGGRGIKFLFTSFEQFFNELGARPEGKSLDRYPNNDGNYEPGNVRWATRKEQANNRRKRSVERLHADLLVLYAKQVMGEI
jgi:hypothetical protein